MRRSSGLAVHAVYYDDDGNDGGYSKNPEALQGIDVDELKTALRLMERAFQLPILDSDEAE